MSYHELDDLKPARLSEAELVQLTNDTAGGTTIVTATYESARDDAEAEIDGYIGARYTLPLGSTPALIKRLSMIITIYHLYRRRFAEGVPEGIRVDYKDAVRMLERLSDGTMTLGVQPAEAQNSERKAQTVSSAPVFSRSSLKDF